MPPDATPSCACKPPIPRQRLVDVLSADVTPQVEAVARQLIAGGDALLVKNSRNAVHGFVLDQDHYDTRIEWTPTELNAICPCETRAGGFVCPHLWATVLLADRSAAFRSLEEAHVHPIFSRNAIPIAGAENAGASNGTPPRRSPNAWPERAGWKIHLASIAQASANVATDASTSVAGLPRQALYIVDAVETRDAGIVHGGTNAVIVELQSRYQRKSRVRPPTQESNGSAESDAPAVGTSLGIASSPGWTKGSSLRLDPNEIETFTEPEDREILSRIVGARLELPPFGTPGASPTTPASTPSMKTSALRGSIGIDLLHRMCNTGRCWLRRNLTTMQGGDEFQLLTWDDGPPYQLIIRIAPHDDGKHYTLTGHLRRDTLTLPVSAAQLLAEPAAAHMGLVFIDGRVARAELRGGRQWIELFTSRGPLHVPRTDMPEFLRQVVSLPTMPRFDLPDDLHFEQIIGTPRPRLIVRRPPRNTMAASGGASKIDERILSTVLFDYDAGAVDALATAAGTYDPSAGKIVLRDKHAEAKALATLHALGFRKQVDIDTREWHYDLPPRLLPSVVPGG